MVSTASASPGLMIVLQVVLGIVAVWILYLVSHHMVDTDDVGDVDKRVKRNWSGKTKTCIINGFVDSNNVTDRRFNTVNPDIKSYVKMPVSYNRKGGVQFSYTFWMYLGDTTSNAVKNKTIMLRGDNRRYSVETKSTTDNGDPRVVVDPDAMIVCPSIKFGSTYRDLIVEINTNDFIRYPIKIPSEMRSTDTTIRHNLMDLIGRKWVMFTFIFEDNVAINDFEDGIIMRFCINDIVYYTHRVKTALRNNTGDLHLFPDGYIPGCRVANLCYFNYAIGMDIIKSLYSAGRPTHHDASILDDVIGDPLYLTEYNKIDVYNM